MTKSMLNVAVVKSRGKATYCRWTIRSIREIFGRENAYHGHLGQDSQILSLGYCSSYLGVARFCLAQTGDCV